MKHKPPPGSPAAIALGCRCPIMDNSHGKGYMGQAGVYVYSGACALHADELDAMVAKSEKNEADNNRKAK